MATTILLTHSPEERRTRFDAKAVAALQRLGQVRINETGGILDAAQAAAVAEGCRIIVSDRLTPADAGLFAAAPEAVALCRTAVDVRNIDLEAASAAGVLVTNCSPAFVDAVAELTFGLMIDVARGISDCVLGYRRGGEPPAPMGVQLAGATLGLIGYGAIGRKVANVGLAFGMTVLVDDPYVASVEPGMRLVRLPALLAASDFVVCLAAASSETDRLMDAAAFAAMKQSAYFINLSRGSLVDDDALEAALTSGRIAGAALDVGNEPGQMPRPSLAALPNVVTTPHIGGLTAQAAEGQALEAVAQVCDILAGRMPRNALNAERATRFHEWARAIGSRD